ncbi:FAD:protein FMN transferase [Marinicella litoralis]|nr:FAD:protein FMN transferase [Marinicella litoralis]
MIINSVLKKTVFLLLFFLFLTSCKPKELNVSKHQLFVFGTLIDINIWHDDEQQVTDAVALISHTFNNMHHQWHAWKPGRLHQINQTLRNGQSVMLSREEAQFIQQTIDQAELSNHLFNPVIGELINLWGFHTDEYPILSPPPQPSEIEHLIQQNLTVKNLHLDGLNLMADNPHVWLDFGGIAKGLAVDLAVGILQQQQIENAIINAGGDLRSIGSKGKVPWRIAIQSPSDWTTVAELEIVGDESVFTSGNYQRYKEFDGKRYSHIIHPTTGMPVGEIVSATVITQDGISADAAATALIVAGSAHWLATAQSMGIKQALIINEQMQCTGTQAMIQRLQNLNIKCQAID